LRPEEGLVPLPGLADEGFALSAVAVAQVEGAVRQLHGSAIGLEGRGFHDRFGLGEEFGGLRFPALRVTYRGQRQAGAGGTEDVIGHHDFEGMLGVRRGSCDVAGGEEGVGHPAFCLGNHPGVAQSGYERHDPLRPGERLRRVPGHQVHLGQRGQLQIIPDIVLEAGLDPGLDAEFLEILIDR